MVFRSHHHSGLSFRSESPTCFRSGLSTGQSVSLGGAVEKIRQRRSRHFSVLTYDSYAPRRKMAAALLNELF